MTRGLLNFLTALSLLLCLGVCALWVRGNFTGDEWLWIRAENRGASHFVWYFALASGHGGVALSCDAEVYDLSSVSAPERAQPVGRWRWRRHLTGPPAYPSPAFFSSAAPPSGFFARWSTSPDTVRREVIVPCWTVALPASIPSMIWLMRRRRNSIRRRRQDRGLCSRCGYDLRATPGRCPECGTSTPAP